MTKEEQKQEITIMAKICCNWICPECVNSCPTFKNAKALFAAGYRKQKKPVQDVLDKTSNFDKK